LSKSPPVATRKDFDPGSVSAERLERIKLEDAVHYHDHVTVELERYARVSGRPKVHPFILVAAQHTDHARELRQFIESDEFFEGRFKDRVTEVHSALTSQESEEATAQLVALETDTRTEIVIHVNKLKEGWDVTNLYTILPLRASASEILTEQTLGRGLRLPYGARIAKGDFAEFATVDRLTVIAHDRFDEVIQRAKEPGSVVQMQTIVIGEGGDISPTGTTLIEAPSFVDIFLTGVQPHIPGFEETPQENFVFRTPEEVRAAGVALQVIQRYERRVGNIDELRVAEVQQKIAAEVTELTQPVQGALAGVGEAVDIRKVVALVAKTVAEKTISVPTIVVLPKKQVTFTYEDFDLDGLTAINLRPSGELLIEDLRTGTRTALARSHGVQYELRPEDYIVGPLVGRDEIPYEDCANLLYKLAAQVVQRLRSYLATEAEVDNVLVSHGSTLADFVFAQMERHCRETPLGEDDYEERVTHGFTLLHPQAFSVPTGQPARSFREAVRPLSDTPRHIFAGFKRCCYPLQKFDSDPERRFAVIVDDDETVEKWMKPGKAQFRITYLPEEPLYEPDFVVETGNRILMCEVKAGKELSDPVVLSKAAAATKWCRAASEHALRNGGKRWGYVLIADDQILANASVSGLAARFERA
jgi:type III restriction enzyme